MDINSKFKLRPIGARVIVRPEKAEDKSKGGIILPDTVNKEKPQLGYVIAVGTGRILDSGTKVAMDVKVDDKVIFSKYAGTEVKIGDVDHLILSESDILAIAE